MSWAVFGLGACVVFFSVPLARTFQAIVAEHLGRVYFLYFVLAAFVAVFYFACLNLSRRKLPASAYLCLFVTGGVFVAGVYELRDPPEEAWHYLEYGLLSVLAYRALVHRFQDPSVYVLSILVAAVVGIVDEWLQWLMPDRQWGFRDVRINVEAASIAQLGIALGLRPGIVSTRMSALGMRRVCQFGAIVLLMLTLSSLNTPQRVAWYAADVPVLSFLLDNESVMAEYGYEYRDSSVGVFRSRFGAEELEQLDATRGAQVARIIDGYDSRESFVRFRRLYTASNAPYVHEVGIHLFRRDRLLERAELKSPSGRTQSQNYNEALRENRILENYYRLALNQSKHPWPEEKLREAEANETGDYQYDSPVSNHLITGLTERQLLTGLALAIAGILLLGYWAGRLHDTGRNS